jgi:hypothetical protein
MNERTTPITDEYMRERLAASRSYTVVTLHRGPRYHALEAQSIIWEHGRRNFELRAAGALAIVGPVPDDTDLAGIGIFTLGIDEVRALMASDPAVAAGVLTAQVHPMRGFPGDGLPAASVVIAER